MFSALARICKRPVQLGWQRRLVVWFATNKSDAVMHESLVSLDRITITLLLDWGFILVPPYYNLQS